MHEKRGGEYVGLDISPAMLAHAREKLERKNFDFIVLNSLNDAGAGFRHDTNKITIITRTEAIPYPLKDKKEVAADIIDRLASFL